MTSPAFHWRKDDDTALLHDDAARPTTPHQTSIKYCLHCEWEARAADGYTEQERTKAALDHYVETGHTVDSIE